MLSFILALLPLLEDVATAGPVVTSLATLISSEGFSAALAGVTFAEWISVAEKVAAAAPAVQKAWSELHPAFAELVKDIGNGIELHDAAGNINAWFRANQSATIPGYGRDGSVTEIPNPDLKPGA